MAKTPLDEVKAEAKRITEERMAAAQAKAKAAAVKEAPKAKEPKTSKK